MDKTNILKILFICKGNICRSPLAEVILKKKLNKHELSNKFKVQSAAIKDYNIGKGANPNAVLVGKKNGYDLSKHTVSMIDSHKLDWADLIVIMDNENREDMINLFGPDVLKKIRFLMSFITGHNDDVIDPYKKPFDEFEKTFKIVEDACEHIIDYLKKEATV